MHVIYAHKCTNIFRTLQRLSQLSLYSSIISLFIIIIILIIYYYNIINNNKKYTHKLNILHHTQREEDLGFFTNYIAP